MRNMKLFFGALAVAFALASAPLSADTVEFDFENLDQTGDIDGGGIGATIFGLNVDDGTASDLTLTTVDVIDGGLSLSNGDMGIGAVVNGQQDALGITDNHFDPNESYVFSFNQDVNLTTIVLESFSPGNNFTVTVGGGAPIALTELADPDNGEFSVNDLGDSLAVEAGENVALTFVGGGPGLIRVVNIQASVVPEPSSLALLALGTIGIFTRRKRV